MIVHDNGPGRLRDGRVKDRLSRAIRSNGGAAMMSSLLRARQAMAWAAAVCVALLAAACGSIAASGGGAMPTVTVTATQPGAPSTGTPAAATPGPCSTAGLRVTLGSRESAAAGHLYRTLDFTSRSVPPRAAARPASG